MATSTELLPELCEPNIQARNKTDLIKEAASILRRHEALQNFSEEQLINSLQERESLGTTGFGDGVAIPHCRLPGLDKFILGIGISRRGVHFDALDGRPVNVFCFLAGPEEDPNKYVKVLAEISVVLRNKNARKELAQAQTETAIYESYRRFSEPEEASEKKVNQKLLMLVLQEEDLVTDVMQIFLEMGVRGASVIESRGMGQVLTSVPLFASFMNFLGSEEEFHRTIFAIIPDTQVQPLIRAIEDRTGDLDRHSGAMAMTMDISMIKGSMEAI